MTIKEYIKFISSKITSDGAYDDYKNYFLQYINYLKNILSSDPRNIKAICQLAIAYMETREPSEKSIDLIEDAIVTYKDTLKKEELTELLNNLAYFYSEGMSEDDKAVKILENAIKLETDFPNTYNALGIKYLEENKADNALKLFNKATSLCDDIKYKNNYAVALYNKKHIEEANEIFLKISNDWQKNHVSAKAYYSYGMIKSLSGEVEVGIKVANDLLTLINNANGIDAFKIAELYYVCKDYKKCISYYDYEKLYPTPDWLNIYFYCFYALGQKAKLYRIVSNIVEEKKSELRLEVLDNDEEWTVEERKLYTQKLEQEIKEITRIYYMIMKGNYKPTLNFEPELIYGCYLIDCPRHSFLKK